LTDFSVVIFLHKFARSENLPSNKPWGFPRGWTVVVLLSWFVGFVVL
jgi:hypothetical protein